MRVVGWVQVVCGWVGGCGRAAPHAGPCVLRTHPPTSSGLPPNPTVPSHCRSSHRVHPCVGGRRGGQVVVGALHGTQAAAVAARRRVRPLRACPPPPRPPRPPYLFHRIQRGRARVWGSDRLPGRVICFFESPRVHHDREGLGGLGVPCRAASQPQREHRQHGARGSGGHGAIAAGVPPQVVRGCTQVPWVRAARGGSGERIRDAFRELSVGEVRQRCRRRSHGPPLPPLQRPSTTLLAVTNSHARVQLHAPFASPGQRRRARLGAGAAPSASAPALGARRRCRP